jgi:FKBP-type peptidyl-prolyl cis-trans isomerase
VGTGTAATPGSLVSVLYVGKLSDGTTFDSSAAHGNAPLTFTLGQQGLIAGFQIGVNGMKVGGERIMSIPSELGYGAQAVTDASGTVIIPANSTLLFDVKLVDVKPGTTTPATTQ